MGKNGVTGIIVPLDGADHQPRLPSPTDNRRCSSRGSPPTSRSETRPSSTRPAGKGARGRGVDRRHLARDRPTTYGSTGPSSPSPARNSTATSPRLARREATRCSSSSSEDAVKIREGFEVQPSRGKRRHLHDQGRLLDHTRPRTPKRPSCLRRLGLRFSIALTSFAK